MTLFAQKTKHTGVWLAIAALIFASTAMPQSPVAGQSTGTQASGLAPQLGPQASEAPFPLPEDRGAAALYQSLKRLGTWASLMDIVAHPDDEDGGMLTYESRGQGVRTSLLTLTRGEGGQNAMSADTYDALGLMRTSELLRAGQYYGVRQYFGTEADFGFSKTQEEAFARWGHERVLYDAVLAVRRERPLVLASTFVGGITDGHGHHQVSGEIAQEAFVAAGDPNVFPDQIAAGLRPWTPLKVYARVPFAPVSDKGMFDYATGKWAPAKFYNYVTKQWTTAAPEQNVDIPTGKYDPVLGRSYIQISREGWGEQRSQYGGANPQLSGGEGSGYHRYGSRVNQPEGEEQSFFDGIPTGIEGLALLASSPGHAAAAPEWLTTGLKEIAADVADAEKAYLPPDPAAIAPVLKAGELATQKLHDRVIHSDLTPDARANIAAELEIKLTQFNTALTQALGLDLVAFTVRSAGTASGLGPFGGGGLDETSRSVSPGEAIEVHIHTGNATGLAKLSRVWLEGSYGKSWDSRAADRQTVESNASGAALSSDAKSGNGSSTEDKSRPDNTPANVVRDAPPLSSDMAFPARVPSDEPPTEPYFSRLSIEQPYYDIDKAAPALRGYPFAPYPLAGWAEFDYQGLMIRLGGVVQTMQRVLGRGGVLEPLVVAPTIGVRVEPEARILPIDGSPLPVAVTVHTQGAAEGKLRLKLPAGWTAEPAEADFKRSRAGDTEPITFLVKPAVMPSAEDKAYTVTAEAISAGHTYTSGWRTVGYPGLRPYNQYRQATLKTRAIDVKVTAGLRIGYVMGTGDTVPEAMQGLGVAPHLMSSGELLSGDLSRWDVIFVGIRAYSARPDLAAAQARLDAWVHDGGTLVVQYQSGTFPAPLPLSLGRAPERVVEEDSPVRLLVPGDRLLSTPNLITARDFDGWVEERGHSFADTWDPGFTAVTETADAGQDPQRGGFLVAHPGKGTYIYIAYALYRQLPELVPGSYRILANLISAGRGPR